LRPAAIRAPSEWAGSENEDGQWSSGTAGEPLPLGIPVWETLVRYLVIGGAGFIGINAASSWAQRGQEVAILDNFSRRGTEENLEWLRCVQPSVRVVRADIRTDQNVLNAEAGQCDVLVHLAAQVAVTTSISDPRLDFEVNAQGTFNVLEAARRAPHPPVVLFSSTNKVYGGMEDEQVAEGGGRHRFERLSCGVSEEQPLDFHSPYGCSKGAADQYVRDYARIYGLRSVVFRQSCIYGPHQFGIEDQGWVAWFALRSLLGQPITIYGDGKQVRDVLHVDDLIAAFDRAVTRIDRVSGHIYNIGGGPANTLSLLELVGLLEGLNGTSMNYSFADWRSGDQRVYISNIRRAGDELGWRPKIDPPAGVARMRAWMVENLNGISKVYGE
jgi:CDP-paratose 2-epimerase